MRLTGRSATVLFLVSVTVVGCGASPVSPVGASTASPGADALLASRPSQGLPSATLTPQPTAGPTTGPSQSVSLCMEPGDPMSIYCAR